MAIHRRRRIFRGGARLSLPIPRLRAALIGLVVAACLGGTMAIWNLQGSAERAVPLSAAVLTAQPAQVAVIDGETLRLAETVLRLDGVTAPPRGKGCADGVDCAAASSAALAGLVRNRPVACRMAGRDAGGPVRAQCTAGGVDLNEAQIRTGWASAETDRPALAVLEAAARQARLGIWGHGAAGF